MSTISLILKNWTRLWSYIEFYKDKSGMLNTVKIIKRWNGRRSVSYRQLSDDFVDKCRWFEEKTATFSCLEIQKNLDTLYNKTRASQTRQTVKICQTHLVEFNFCLLRLPTHSFYQSSSRTQTNRSAVRYLNHSVLIIMKKKLVA